MNEDELIDELVDLIVHKPPKGGFFGVGEKEHLKCKEQIHSVILRLKS